MLDKRLDNMRWNLKDMAEKEAIRLWRLARRAQEHGVSASVVHEIREEGSIMHTTMTAYPDRLLAWDFQYKYKYAFK